MRRLRLVLFSIIVLLAGTSGLIFAGTSAAQMPAKESCPATLNGVNVRYMMTPGTALEVPFDGTVVAAFNSDQKITAHQVMLSFGEHVGFHVEDAADDATAWSAEIPVARYARYGVGIYQVRAETWGPGGCVNIGYVKVTGKNPLSTPAGAGGAVATAIGIMGMGASFVEGTKKGPDLAGKVPQGDDFKYTPPPDNRCLGLCAMNLVKAFLQTGVFMVSGAGTIGAPVVITPYISLASLAGSFLAGLGTLVLGQQFALFFPTTVLTLLWMAGWLALGFAIPNAARVIAVRKANAIIAGRGAASSAETVSLPADEATAIIENETTEE